MKILVLVRNVSVDQRMREQGKELTLFRSPNQLALGNPLVGQASGFKAQKIRSALESLNVTGTQNYL